MRPIDQTIILIGRDPECDVILDNRAVDFFHAHIDFGENFVVIDNVSLNGTFVNGEKVEKAVLRPGDVITIARYEIHIRSLRK
ncbi:MAG: FHA domain-containing protein [Candidatus Aenigmatarchaeota archaeon]